MSQLYTEFMKNFDGCAERGLEYWRTWARTESQSRLLLRKKGCDEIGASIECAERTHGGNTFVLIRDFQANEELWGDSSAIGPLACLLLEWLEHKASSSAAAMVPVALTRAWRGVHARQLQLKSYWMYLAVDEAGPDHVTRMKSAKNHLYWPLDSF